MSNTTQKKPVSFGKSVAVFIFVFVSILSGIMVLGTSAHMPLVISAAVAAAVGVACHEVGHAIQHATNYAPVKIRSAIVPITNIGAKISVPLIIIGLLLASFGDIFIILAYVGVACFGLSTVFQLVTLPTEFDASRRALNTIEETNLLTGEEFKQAKQVLTAAAMTYVAALAVSFMQLLRFLIIVGGNRRD